LNRDEIDRRATELAVRTPAASGSHQKPLLQKSALGPDLHLPSSAVYTKRKVKDDHRQACQSSSEDDSVKSCGGRGRGGVGGGGGDCSGATQGAGFSSSKVAGQSNRHALDRLLRENFGKQFVDNLYVPGHCWYESISISSTVLCGTGPRLGAFLTRRILSSTYRDRNTRLSLKNELGLVSRLRMPSFSDDSAREQDLCAGITAGTSLTVSSEQSHWHDIFFDERAFMMLSVDCSKPTSSLWEYNIDIDLRAITLALLRPIIMVGTTLLPMQPSIRWRLQSIPK